MNIALFSPNNNAYSETFIQAHKNLLAGNVFYYYNGFLPRYYLGDTPQSLLPATLLKKIWYKLKLLFNKEFSLPELCLKDSLHRNKVDLVLTEFGTVGANSLHLCKKMNLPLIVHFHGYDATMKNILAEYSTQYKEMFSYASKIISVSQEMSDRLIALGCPQEKIVLNPCGPNALFLNLKPVFKHNHIIATGRFVDKKAPYYLILVMQKVVTKVPDAKLFIAGEGPLLEVSKNLCKQLKLEKHIEFLGAVKHQRVLNTMENCSCFVQHSITANSGDTEGTPVAIMEAGAAGLPIVATAHAGIKDVIVHNQTGYLVEEHDIEGMAEYIIKLLNDRNMAKEMGKKGKARIENFFSMDMHINKLNQAVSESLAKK